MGSEVKILEADDRIEIYYLDNCLKTCRKKKSPVQKKLGKIKRRVTANGTFGYKGRHFSLGTSYSGKQVEIKEQDNGKRIIVYIDEILILGFDIKEGKKY